MPSNVARFERFMYLSVAIGLLQTVLNWNQLVLRAAPLGGAGFVLFVDSFVFAIMVLMIWLVARRRKNWARWLLLILFLVGLPGAARSYVHLFRNNPLVGVLSTVQGLLQIIAFYLIFTGNAREWFKHPATDSIPR